MATQAAYAAINPAETNVPVNPVTKQTEALDPNVAVNTGKYSVENKRALAEASGLDPYKVPMDAFYRAPSSDGTGTLAIKPNVVANPAMQYDESGYMRKVSEIGGKLGQAYENNKYSTIVESIKAKTGGVADIDAKLTELQYQRNKLRPQLMAKYASVIDPVKREALIAGEEQALDSQIANITGIREKRAGTISEMIQAEVKDKENTLNALAKQYDVARNALGDIRAAEKTKKEMERLNLEIEKDKLEIDRYKAHAQYAAEGDRLDIAAKYKSLYGTAPTEGGMRTDRHNNPTAFTTDIAKQAGLVEGVDYTVGDSFGGGKFATARIIGDPIAATIKVIDKIGFTTQSGANRWTYTDKLGLTNEKWKSMTSEQKADAIKQMYKQEGGSGSIFSGGASTPASTDVERYLTNSSFTEPEKEKIRADAKANNLTIEQVKANYPTKAAAGKEWTFEDAVKQIAADGADAQAAFDALRKAFPTKSENTIYSALENAFSDSEQGIAVKSMKYTKALWGTSVYVGGKKMDVNVKNIRTIVDSLINEIGAEEANLVINESNLLTKSGFKPWTINDDDGYDFIQEAFSEAGYEFDSTKRRAAKPVQQKQQSQPVTAWQSGQTAPSSYEWLRK